MSTLDNLRKSAKRWLKALRAKDADARARLGRAYPNAPANPGLRDVQHALARECGHESWIALRNAHGTPDLEKCAGLAMALLSAHERNHSPAMQRLQEHYARSFTWEELRTAVRQRLDAVRDSELPVGEFTLAHARLLVAREAGFEDWAALEQAYQAPQTQTASEPIIETPAPLDLTASMIQPVEMRATLPMRLHGGALTTTADVWNMLEACRARDLDRVRSLVAVCPSLVLCDYNYMAPLHLAVREGHLDLVHYLVSQGAANPNYVTYPYREDLVTLALDRGNNEIAQVLQAAYQTADANRPEDEGGEIDYGMDAEQKRFQKLLNGNDIDAVEKLLQQRPALAHNPFAFWSEGVLMMPAKLGNRKMIELLMRYGSRVPDVSKWGAWYYLWVYEIAAFLLERGMNPNHMNCHHTTVLHDMAYKGDTRKVALLLDHGADVNAIDEEFRSTPLGFAARWGHRDVVAQLIERGADVHASGAAWATPLAWAQSKGHTAIESDLRHAGAPQ